MVAMMAPCAFAAEGEADPVAKIGEQGYATLAAAVQVVETYGTIVLEKDTTEDITIPSDKDFTLDLNGKKLTNSSGDTIVNHGRLEIVDTLGNGEVDNVTNAKAAINNDGTVVLRGGTYTRSQEAGKDKDNGGGNSFYTILNDKGGSLTIYEGVKVYNNGHFSSMIRNGGTVSDKESMMYIIGGTFSGGINTVKNDENGYLNIASGDFSNTTQFVVMNWHRADIYNDPTFTVNDTAEAVLFTSSYGGADTVKGELTISGGTFRTATDTQDDHYDASNKGTAYISGGFFKKDVTKYCVTGKMAKQGKDGLYSIVDIPPVRDDSKITRTVGDQQQNVPSTGDGVAASDKTAAANVASSVDASLGNAAKTVTASKEDTANAVDALLKQGKITLTDDGKVSENVTLEVQPYLDVTTETYNMDKKQLKLEITPKYNVAAYTTDDTNKVIVSKANPMTVNTPTGVTITLPAGFVDNVNQNVYIKHEKNGKTYLYEGKLAPPVEGQSQYALEFTSLHGFSPFTATTALPLATITKNGVTTAYDTLQDAANAAASGDEIVLNSGEKHTLQFTETKSVKVTNRTGAQITVAFNGVDKPVANEKFEMFSYRRFFLGRFFWRRLRHDDLSGHGAFGG